MISTIARLYPNTVCNNNKPSPKTPIVLLWKPFEEGAKVGVTRLLAAFFFRQYGTTPRGDPTFVFTHKSFGEYLAALRVVRAIKRINDELSSHDKDPDSGWDEKEALKRWAEICGPNAISPYLYKFLLNEMKLHSGEELVQWQDMLS